jgi:hypothetical protein
VQRTISTTSKTSSFVLHSFLFSALLKIGNVFTTAVVVGGNHCIHPACASFRPRFPRRPTSQNGKKSINKRNKLDGWQMTVTQSDSRKVKTSKLRKKKNLHKQ